MTTARLQRKSRIFRHFACFGIVVALLAAVAGPGRSATSQRVVADWHTGLALYGFDPVGYFTDHQPLVGRPEFEFRFAGVIWRFRNEGNRAAFADHPEVYMPRFGGYDPTGVARGVARPGHPRFWLIVNQRLFLFHNAEARDAFAADSDHVMKEAAARWGEVLHALP
jgi:hypothetical protein